MAPISYDFQEEIHALIPSACRAAEAESASETRRAGDPLRVTESQSPGTGPIHNLFLNFVYLCRNTRRHRAFQKLGPCEHDLSSEEMRLGEFNSSSQKLQAVINGSSMTSIPGWGCWVSPSLLGLRVTRTAQKCGKVASGAHLLVGLHDAGGTPVRK